MPIFLTPGDYMHFLKTVIYYQIDDIKPKLSHFNPKIHNLNKSRMIVNIICYSFMPNHFHLLLQQIKDGGITEFVSKTSNSYTKYINTKHERVGPLFQGEFKAKHVDSDEQILHLSRYIHLNPLIGFVCKDLNDFQWSSYMEYLGQSQANLCKKDIILGQFKNIEDYKQFVLDQEEYGKKLENLKHLRLD